jgi:hypothetical protein
MRQINIWGCNVLLYVYDKTITLLGVVEQIASLIWTQRKYTCGTFDMLLPVTENNLKLLQKHRLIVKDDDGRNEPGEILYTRIKKAVSGGEELEVTGKFLTHWLGDRLVRPNIVTAAPEKPQDIMRRAVAENAADNESCTQVARRFPLLQLGSQTETRPQAAIDFANEENISVLALCETLAAAEDTGYTVTLDPAAGQFNFDIYTGGDYTAAGGNPRIFSVEFENVLEQEFIRSVENLKNAAYVYGEDNGIDTLYAEVGTAAGHARKEVFINASSIKKQYKDANNETQTIEDPDYKTLLAAHGAAELEQYKETLNFFSKINAAAGGYRYGTDYTLGDKVTCLSEAWGLSIDVVITEVETTYQDGQKEVYITFGEALPTLLDKIKNLTKTR